MSRSAFAYVIPFLKSRLYSGSSLLPLYTHLLFIFKKFVCAYIFVYMHDVCVGVCARAHVCGHQRRKFQRWLPPLAFLWLLGTEHRSTACPAHLPVLMFTVFVTF